MTLRELRAKYPTHFYPQMWFDGEGFMDHPGGHGELPMPSSIGPEPGMIVPYAVDLARLYLKTPGDPIWARFLWTRDEDDVGQRIYVGGIGQARLPGFQIHRHLKLDDKWGFAQW